MNEPLEPEDLDEDDVDLDEEERIASIRYSADELEKIAATIFMYAESGVPDDVAEHIAETLRLIAEEFDQ